MSDYPALTLENGDSALSSASSRVPNDGQVLDYGDDGVARVRVLYQATQWVFELDYPALTATQVSDLLAHYAAHRLASFGFTWPGDQSSYTCQYLTPPRPRESPGLGCQGYSVTLAGVAT